MRWPPRSALLGAACTLILAAPAAAQVPAGSKTVTVGAIAATLSWQAGETIVATKPHLRIDRGGATLLDRDIGRECMLCDGVGDPPSAVHVVDLDGDGEPEVLTDHYSGGAHCCLTTLIWYLDGQGYRRRVASWGDQGYRRKDLDGDGRPELITADDRFAYAFTAFAYSWFPPLVFDWSEHRLLDVTRKYPDRIRADLVEIRKLLPRARRDGDPRGLVAAYVADEYLLGHGQAGLRYLEAARRRGDLRAIPKGDKTWASGRGYRAELLRFLRKTGYR